MVLTGTNTYSGGTAIFGTLQVSSGANIGSGTATITIGGGTLQAAGNLTLAAPIVVIAGGGLIDENGYSITLSGDITGDSGLSVADESGGGSLVIGGTLTVEASSLLNLSATVVVSRALDNYGTVENLASIVVSGTVINESTGWFTVDTGSTMEVQSTGVMTNYGTTKVSAAGTLAVDLYGTYNGDGHHDGSLLWNCGQQRLF